MTIRKLKTMMPSLKPLVTSMMISNVVYQSHVHVVIKEGATTKVFLSMAPNKLHKTNEYIFFLLLRK